MRKLLLITAILLTGFMAQAQQYCISPDGAGRKDGSDWANAGDLNLVKSLDRDGSSEYTLLFKSGTYLFSEAINFDNLFIYGGFDGTETQLSERDWAKNQTIFDGQGTSSLLRNSTDTNRPGGNTASIPCLLDGVILQNATNNGNGGAMIINNGAKISNCIFRNNATSTANGAAFHCHNSTSSGSFIISNCLFINNTSIGNGGAVQIGAAVSATFINCTFANNKASRGANNNTNRGGAIGLANDKAIATFVNCIAFNNMGGDDSMESIGPNSSTVNAGDGVVFYYTAMETACAKFVDKSNGCFYLSSTGTVDSKIPDFESPASIIGKGDESIVNVASYKLKPTSVCIDKGDQTNQTFTDANFTLDLAAKQRIVGNNVDMGAYEYSPVTNIPAGVFEKNTIKAISAGNELLISGVKAGDILKVYNLQGSLVYSQEIKGEYTAVPLQTRGVYVVVAGHDVLKVKF